MEGRGRRLPTSSSRRFQPHSPHWMTSSAPKVSKTRLRLALGLNETPTPSLWVCQGPNFEKPTRKVGDRNLTAVPCKLPCPSQTHPPTPHSNSCKRAGLKDSTNMVLIGVLWGCTLIRPLLSCVQVKCKISGTHDCWPLNSSDLTPSINHRWFFPVLVVTPSHFCASTRSLAQIFTSCLQYLHPTSFHPRGTPHSIQVPSNFPIHFPDMPPTCHPKGWSP